MSDGVARRQIDKRGSHLNIPHQYEAVYSAVDTLLETSQEELEADQHEIDDLMSTGSHTDHSGLLLRCRQYISPPMEWMYNHCSRGMTLVYPCTIRC